MAISKQVTTPCNGVYTEIYTASAGNTFSTISVNGTPVTIGTNVISASLNGSPIVTNPPFRCDTIEISYNVAQVNNEIIINQLCDDVIAMLSFHFRGVTFKQIEYLILESMPNATINGLFGVPLTDFTFEYKSSLAGTYTTLTSTQFISTIALAPANSYMRISYVGTYNIDEALVIQYSTGLAQSNPSLTYNSIPIDQDSVVAFNSIVQLSNITAPNSTSVFAKIRTTNPSSSDWTSYPNDILTPGGLTALNTELSTLAPPYALHFAHAYSGVNTSGAFNSKAEVSSAGRLRKVTTLGSSTTPNYRQMNQTLANDGISDFLQIPNFFGLPEPQRLWSNTPFSMSFWGNIKNNNGVVISSTNVDGVPGSERNTGLTFGVPLWAGNVFQCNFNYLQAGLSYTQSLNLQKNKWYHFVLTYNGLSATDSALLYIDGYKYTMPRVSTPTPGNELLGRNHNYPIFIGKYNGSVSYWQRHNLADFILFDRVITPEEVRILFNRGTNIATNYATNYPAALLNDRILHYSFDTPNYTNNTPLGLVTVGDLSGNARDGIINGQGSTPSTISFY